MNNPDDLDIVAAYKDTLHIQHQMMCMLARSLAMQTTMLDILTPMAAQISGRPIEEVRALFRARVKEESADYRKVVSEFWAELAAPPSDDADYWDRPQPPYNQP